MGWVRHQAQVIVIYIAFRFGRVLEVDVGELRAVEDSRPDEKGEVTKDAGLADLRAPEEKETMPVILPTDDLLRPAVKVRSLRRPIRPVHLDVKLVLRMLVPVGSRFSTHAGIWSETQQPPRLAVYEFVRPSDSAAFLFTSLKLYAAAFAYKHDWTRTTSILGIDPAKSPPQILLRRGTMSTRICVSQPHVVVAETLFRKRIT